MNKVIKNILYNFSGNIVSKVLSFATVAVTTRMFGSAIFGQYNIAYAEYSYFSLFALMGMNGYGLFLLAKEKELQKQQIIISEICGAKVISGVLISGALLSYILLIPNSHKFIAPYILLLLFQFADISWILHAFQDMKLTAYGALITIVVNVSMLSICYYTNVRSIHSLIWANVLSTLILYMIYVIYFKRKYHFLLFLRVPPYFHYIKKAFPYMISGFFAGINANIDMVIMGYMLNSQEVGYYSVAFRLVNEFIAICAVIFTPLFPVFVERIASGDLIYLNRVAGVLRTGFTSFVVPCAFCSIIYGEEILGFLFGQEYRPGADSFAVLMIFVVLLYYREIYGYALTAAGKQTVYVKIVAISALFNVVTNFILIPQYGILAAAYTTLCSESINFGGMRFYAKKYIGIKPNKSNLSKMVLPLIIFFLTLVMGRCLNIHFILTIIFSGILYAIVCFRSNIFDFNLFKKLR